MLEIMCTKTHKQIHYHLHLLKAFPLLSNCVSVCGTAAKWEKIKKLGHRLQGRPLSMN